MRTQRLDLALVERGFFESRNQAVEAIKLGEVSISERVIKKPSFKVSNLTEITIKEKPRYLSRSALKLKYYLQDYPLDLEQRVAIDIGSSTGGFTQVLLEYGVKSVDAVDVGSNQLHHSLRKNRKIELFEQTDIRDFKSSKEYGIVVSDVSFISLIAILPKIVELSGQNSDIILLFKPQFEVGRSAKRDSKGVVLDKKAVEDARANFEQKAESLRLKLIRTTPSKQLGKEGNQEYIYHFKKGLV
jgi:23S rRNA (cytidine1920-2'-O)/16S rRNA (cytidine1409-2'-O)-methyltransferase